MSHPVKPWVRTLFPAGAPSPLTRLLMERCCAVQRERGMPLPDARGDAPDMLILAQVGQDVVGFVMLHFHRDWGVWEIGLLGAARGYSHNQLFKRSFLPEIDRQILHLAASDEHPTSSWVVQRVDIDNAKHMAFMERCGFTAPDDILDDVMAHGGYIPHDPVDDILVKRYVLRSNGM